MLPLIMATFLFGCGQTQVQESHSPALQKASTSSSSTLLGRWQIEWIQDRPVIDRSPAHLIFQNESQLSGSASCNAMTTQYKVEGNLLSIQNSATTRMMCAPALMEQEMRLLTTLPIVHHFAIENSLLHLYDSHGKLAIKASKVDK